MKNFKLHGFDFFGETPERAFVLAGDLFIFFPASGMIFCIVMSVGVIKPVARFISLGKWQAYETYGERTWQIFAGLNIPCDHLYLPGGQILDKQ